MKNEAAGRDAVEDLFELDEGVEFGEDFTSFGMLRPHAIDGLLKERLGEIDTGHVEPRQSRPAINDHRIYRHPALQISERHRARGSCRSFVNRTDRASRRKDRV